jgi:hypothetical protein
MFVNRRHRRRTRQRIAEKLRGVRRERHTRDLMAAAHACSPEAHARFVAARRGGRDE